MLGATRPLDPRQQGGCPNHGTLTARRDQNRRRSPDCWMRDTASAAARISRRQTRHGPRSHRVPRPRRAGGNRRSTARFDRRERPRRGRRHGGAGPPEGPGTAAPGMPPTQDVAHDVPGLSMRSAGPGLTEYEARGIASNGGAAPTVGFYLDEIPLSPPAVSQSGKVVIDPTLYDLDRIEVLRGPQGTLYGSGSIGRTGKVL